MQPNGVSTETSKANAFVVLVTSCVVFAVVADHAAEAIRSVLSSSLMLVLLAAAWWDQRRKAFYKQRISAAYADLERSEAAFRILAESTGDIIVRFSVPDLRHLEVSPACRTVLGFAPDELLDRTLAGIIHPEDREGLGPIMDALAANKPEAMPASIAYRMKNSGDHWLWVDASINATRDKDGSINGLICSIRDVDERRRVEAARAASEARFRLLAENACELIVLGFDDGRRSYISPASQRMLGFTPTELEAEMSGKRWVHPDDIDYLAKAELATDDKDTFVQCRVRRKDGAYIWVEAIFRRISQGSDDEPTIIATFRDVTERQANAQILNEAKEAAEAARRAAEQASRAKSDFLATMSHEIRTPLNAILGFVGLLDGERELSVQGRRHLTRVKDAGHSLRVIVDDILDFSTLEAGKISLKPTAFCLSSLVERSASMVQELARRKQLDLIVDVDQSTPAYLLGDEDRLRQVLVNLLNNAVKFTRQGGIKLRVGTTETSASTAGLRFEIADTGIGIPQDKRASLFQRFSQVDGSISREFGGTGLGLAICRNLVEAMGGTIGVESEVEAGSTFWIELALPIAALPALPKARGFDRDAPSFDDLVATIVTDREAEAEFDDVIASWQLQILLVEDIKLNQELMCALLQRLGHCVDVVGNGSEAIMAVEDKLYDLVLMDLQMPYVDGVSATRVIRNLPTPRRFVPIVALTASVLGEQTDAALAVGMDAVLTKPVSQDHLDEVLRKSALGEIGVTEDRGILDHEIADKLERAIGRTRVRSARAQLMASLSARFNADLGVTTAAPLRAEAHASIAGAAMLGFVRFAALCRAFIAADADDADDAYAAVRRELRSVVRSLNSDGDDDVAGQRRAA